MIFTLKKSLYDNLAPWKWTALKHVMGDLNLGVPGGLDPEAPILDPDGVPIVVFGDSGFTAERAAALRLVLAGMDALPDDLVDTPEAILSAVSDKASMINEWQPDVAYIVGQVVFFNGMAWRCLQAHTSQADWTPTAAVSLWAGQRDTGGATPDEWVQPTGAHDAYNTGDRVTFQGQVWESLIDANVWSPTVYPAGWRLIP